MKKSLMFVGGLILMASTSNLSAQKYLGLSNSNYSGVYGGQYNPAKLADKKVRLAVNLASVNAFIDNDYYKYKHFSTIFSNERAYLGYKAVPSNSSSEYVNNFYGAEVLGPAFQFTIGDRLGLGASSRVRVFSNTKNLHTYFANALTSNRDANSSVLMPNPSTVTMPNIVQHSLSDLGISGAYAVVDNDAIRLSIGLGVKMYRGVVYNHFRGLNVPAAGVTRNNAIVFAPGSSFEVTTSDASLDDKFSGFTNVMKSTFGSNTIGTGFGGDVGFEMSFKGSNSEKPYAVKVGAGLHDIGKITYKNLTTHTVTATLTGNAIEPENFSLHNVNALSNYFRNRGFSVNTVTGVSREVMLPTNLDAYVDYSITKNFFVSANGVVNLVQGNYSAHYNNMVSLVPRFESKWIDVAVPVSYGLMSKDIKPGLALRLGPLSIGSDDLKILVTNSKGANVYAGLGFVLAKPQDKTPATSTQTITDSDNDGVADNIDRCPMQAGPSENAGCPWPDTDGDGVIDRDDKCPNQAGAKDNSGCPWPDSDNDGVVDRDDKCPNVAGVKENDGCPKTPEVIAEEVTLQLQNILFDFGKSTISDKASLERLDTAARIIKEDGGTYLISGHTDKKGNPSVNLRISKERAAAVVKALEERGVPDNQLKSVGVGSQLATVPATASDAERQKDRKVVVRYVKGAEWDSLQKSDLVSVKKTTKKATKKTGKKVVRKKKK